MASKRVIDQSAQFFFWIQSRGRAEKRMFLSFVYRFSNHVANGLAENVLLGHAVDLLVHRLRTQDFHYSMVKERHAAFDRVCHFHAIAEHIQDVPGQQGL